jgi:hypothetical protein
MPDVALLGLRIALLKPVLRNNWKVPEHVYNSLVLLLNIQRAAVAAPGKACYLLNFAKIPSSQANARRDRFVSDCAHRQFLGLAKFAPVLATA